MDRAFMVVSIILSALLIVLILLQVKGSGLGDLLGGGEMGVARTRRGLEKTLFQITIGLSVAFMAVAILAVAYAP